MYLGIEISSTDLGFGVNYPANGVLPGTVLDVDIVQDLLYWDGDVLAPTTATMRFVAPTFDSDGSVIIQEIDEYVVTADSGYLTGMHHGTYSGNNFWEAHGLFFLEPLTAAPGMYGLGARILASNHVDSNPFLMPFVYDPNNQWTSPQETVGRDRLRAAVNGHAIADLNRDGHVDVVDVDSLVAQIVAGTHALEFDLTGDGLVDDDDLNEWLAQAGAAKLPVGNAFLEGDANLDGTVDGLDYLAWNMNKFSSVAAWSAGDFNADGFVDGQDFIIWNENKFLTAEFGSVVPEASSWVLVILAVPWFLRARRMG